MSTENPSQVKATKFEVIYRLDREYEAVRPLIDDPHKINLSNYQIYKSRWTIPKCLYLACRFGLLLCWPIVMYALLFDHNEESCQPFLVITSILFMLFVRPALFVVTHKFTLYPSIYHRLAMPPSMSICPPCIYSHRRKTLVVGHLSTLPLCLPLRHLLEFSERNDTPEGNLSNVRQNSMSKSCASKI